MKLLAAAIAAIISIGTGTVAQASEPVDEVVAYIDTEPSPLIKPVLPETHSACGSLIRSGGSFAIDCNGGRGIYYARAHFYYYRNGYKYGGWAWGSAALVPAPSRGCVTYQRSWCAHRWTQCPVLQCYVDYGYHTHG